jgi:hypothetical protein
MYFARSDGDVCPFAGEEREREREREEKVGSSDRYCT